MVQFRGDWIWLIIIYGNRCLHFRVRSQAIETTYTLFKLHLLYFSSRDCILGDRESYHLFCSGAKDKRPSQWRWKINWLNDDGDRSTTVASFGGSVDQADWFGPKVGCHLLLVLHLPDEPGELLQRHCYNVSTISSRNNYYCYCYSEK